MAWLDVASVANRCASGTAFVGERLPGSVGALLGLAGVASFVARTVSRRAAGYVALVGLTLPLAFVPARWPPGGELASGAMVLALSLLGAAALDPTSSRRRRGSLAVGGAALLAGAATLAAHAAAGRLSLDLQPSAAGMAPRTFEQLVPALTCGLGPWVLFAPFALVARRRSRGALALALATAVALLAFGLAGARMPLPFACVAPLLAGLVGVDLADLSGKSRRPSTKRAAAVLAIGWLVARDLATFPDRLLAPLVTPDGSAANAAALACAAKVAAGLLMAVTLAVAAALWFPRAGKNRALALAAATWAAAPVLAGLALRLVVYPPLLGSGSGHRPAQESLRMQEVR